MQNINNTGGGGYIFISHSYKDIRDIRPIRNQLEDYGLEPICFNLRCLSDEDEIFDLIRREIDAREWFLYVDSQNARDSKWVQSELDYIKKRGNGKLVTVSLDDPDSIFPVLKRISNSMRVFLSYSHKDLEIARKIYDACVAQDLKVYLDYFDLKSGDDFPSSIATAITEASERGCVVIIVSENSIHLETVKKELIMAIEKGAMILPVVVNECVLTDTFDFLLADVQYYKMTTPVTEEQITKIVSIINSLLLERLHGEK